MKELLKYIVRKTYKPLLVQYLSGTRSYKYRNIKLEVPAGVFHPRFFFSTKLLLRYISSLVLSGKTFLELGAGSGLIAIYAAKKNAHVTATDISSLAIRALKKNSLLNKVEMRIIQSDLFFLIPKQRFDVIAVNPPYYKENPVTEKDHAWYCGVNGEYFQNLFAQLPEYMHANSEVLMIVCDGCDIEMISALANKNSFTLNCVFTDENLLEKNFIYRIEYKNG